MDRFWDAWEKSTIVSGILALGLLGVICYLAVIQAPIPAAVASTFGAVVGFFFGAKGRDETRRAVDDVRAERGY